MIQLQVKDNFLASANDRQKTVMGFWMWFFIFLGYFCFSFNWIILGKLEGGSTNGWSKDFSVTDNTALLESVNYSIPFARGIATIPVAFFMKKLTHKYTVILATLLNTAAYPLVFSPYFSLFVLGRIIMAFGGTMLVILVQPILSCFFNQKLKSFFSIVNLTAYVLAGLISNLLFVIPSLDTVFLSNWRLVAAVAGSLTYIPFLLYIAFGKNFVIENPEIKVANTENTQLKPSTYKEVIKEKDMWFWIFFYSFCLVVSVVVANFVPKVIGKLAPGIAGSFSTWKSVYSIIFYVGYLTGFSIGSWNRVKARRKPFILFFVSVGFFCWILILLCALLLSSYTTLATVLIFIFAYIFAFCSLGIQSVIFYVPHEYPGNSPKRITIFFSYMWGFGYLLLGFYSAIAAKFLDINTVGVYICAVFITILIAMTAIFGSLIKETRISWPIIPISWAKKLGIKEKCLYHKDIRKKLNPVAFSTFDHENLSQSDSEDSSNEKS